MKTKLFLAIIAFLSTNLITAQVEDVVTGLNGPKGIVFN
jgi:hypothetical protein